MAAKISNLKLPLKLYSEKLSFWRFKANLCRKNIAKALNIDLKIILKTFDGKKFKFKIAVKDLLGKKLNF